MNKYSTQVIVYTLILIALSSTTKAQSVDEMRRQIEALKAKNAHLKEINRLQAKNKSLKADLQKTKSSLAKQNNQATTQRNPDVPAIKKRILAGEFLNRIAADYDVNPGRISEIKTERVFALIPPAA